MDAESHKEIEDFLRAMRQAYNTQDMKAFRQHFWTNPGFVHLDASGRMDEGWGSFEEVLDQEFRYLDSVQLNLRNTTVRVFDGRYALVTAEWKLSQVDPGGRAQDIGGRASFTLVRLDGREWKIVGSHYTALESISEEA
ncbi:MAG: nuclear transport factor 2 family protein [Planctomycetota bacterium]